LLTKIPHALTTIKQAGEVANFLIWQQESFERIRMFFSKKSLFKEIARRIYSENSHVEVHEFGVAHGYLTRLILSIDSKLQFVSEYHGYDTFEGLPKAFRTFPVGSFSNFGKFPRIESVKLVWHKGFVEDLVSINSFSNSQKLIIFDLDLFEPSLFVYKKLREKLNAKDFIYFDEGYDQNEFEIIKANLQKDYFLDYVGTTGQGIAFQVRAKKDEN
jgi:hypothetical protein